ncbi:MAG: helix-hairpin-helix domain-containing protein [Ruminiclostridium sp.]|nr:helix-hairpin-helix domain-containing protein [Ruminiclostridium sp.]
MKFSFFGKKIIIRKEYTVIGVLLLFVLLTLYGWYLKTNRIEVFVTDESAMGSELQTGLIGGVAQIGKSTKPDSREIPIGKSTKPESKGTPVNQNIEPASMETQIGHGTKSERKEALINETALSNPDNSVVSFIVDQNNSLTNPTLNDNDDGALININTAGAEELIKLNGIGKVKSEAIIAYREKNGFFNSTDEIMNVKGIGEATYSKIKDYITVGKKS